MGPPLLCNEFLTLKPHVYEILFQYKYRSALASSHYQSLDVVCLRITMAIFKALGSEIILDISSTQEMCISCLRETAPVNSLDPANI